MRAPAVFLIMLMLCGCEDRTQERERARRAGPDARIGHPVVDDENARRLPRIAQPQPLEK